MKGTFKYLGRLGQKDFIEVVLDDERGLNQMGIDICFHYFSINFKTHEITALDHSNMDLMTLNTTYHYADGSSKPSISSSVTKTQSEAYFQYFKAEYATVFFDYISEQTFTFEDLQIA